MIYAIERIKVVINYRKRTRILEKKNPLISMGNALPILIITNLILIALLIILFSDKLKIVEGLNQAELQILIMEEQRNKLEEDIESKNSTNAHLTNQLLILEDTKNELYGDISILTTELLTMEEEKDETIDRLIEHNQILTKEKLNSDEVQLVLLSEKYGYCDELGGEDLLYLSQEIERYDNLANNEHAIDIILGLYKTESDYNHMARNTKSTARGLGQFLEGTARWIWETRLGNPVGSYTHDMAFDKKINIQLTCNYLSYLLNMYDDDLKKALIAYNGNEIGEKFPKAIQGYIHVVAGIDILK